MPFGTSRDSLMTYHQFLAREHSTELQGKGEEIPKAPTGVSSGVMGKQLEEWESLPLGAQVFSVTASCHTGAVSRQSLSRIENHGCLFHG